MPVDKGERGIEKERVKGLKQKENTQEIACVRREWKNKTTMNFPYNANSGESEQERNAIDKLLHYI